MSISIACPNCGKALRVKDEWAGRRATCPGCGTTFPVPGTAAAPDAPIAANAPPGSQPSPPPPSSTSPKSPTLTGIITLIVAVAVGVPTYLWTRGPHGHRATTAELIGHW